MELQNPLPSPPDGPRPPLPEHTTPPVQRLLQRLAYLYGEAEAESELRRIERIIRTHQQLRGQPLERPAWSERDVVLITYGNTLRTPDEPSLRTLRRFLKQHLANAFSMVHILPFFPWSSDDGFSVTDFRAVSEDLGSWLEIRKLSEDFDLVFDLVLNHCSRENLWFLDYLIDEPPACHYFIEAEPDIDLSAVTRPRSTPLLSGVRTRHGVRHVWTTFSNDQIDMNYANADVLIEFVDLLLYYIRRGARMIRLDAVAYLWKEVGTPCIHLPQTHQVVKLMRDVLEMVEPDALLMTETNVPHEENLSYFGNGDEAHLIYQFSLPPLLLYSLHSGDTRYLLQWAQSLEQTPLPDGCSYFNFTASHDGVGLRPLEGLVPGEEIQELLEAMRARGGFISSRANEDGSESPYELNISYFDAFREIDGENRYQIEKFLLSQIIALSLQGIPGIYFHSLTATPNDIEGVERTERTRAINRHQWELQRLEQQLDDPESDCGQLFPRFVQILQLRKEQSAFHPAAEQQIIPLGAELFCFERHHRKSGQSILVLANFTHKTVSLDYRDLPCNPRARQEQLQLSTPDYQLEAMQLPPYGIYWFSN